jgi:hypothetical protein
MGVLAEYLRTESEQLKADKIRRRDLLQDWLASLNALFQQMETWLISCDPERLIDRTIEEIPGPELVYGDYRLPVWKLTLVDRSVTFEPVARNMAAKARAPGQELATRVHGGIQVRGFGGRVSYLFRLADGQWYMQKEFENLRVVGNDVVPLDSERFEILVRKAFE